MKVLAANIEEVFREAFARWTLIAWFVLSSLFIFVFASAINLDVVDGSLAGMRLFGQDVNMSGEAIDIDRLVLGFQSGFAAVLYLVGIFLAIFATAHLVPRMQDKGTVDLYLSRPVRRSTLLLSRYLAGLLLAASNVVYLIGTIWLIIVWKTGVVQPRFLLSGAIILFAIAALLAFAFLVGVVTSSTAVSIMSTYALFFLSAALAAHDRIEAAIATQWKADAIHALYWIFPKTSELGSAVVAYVSGGQVPDQLMKSLSFAPFASTAAFAVASLFLALVLFQRKEF